MTGRGRTQKEKVLWRIQQGPACGTVFLQRHIPRYAARVAELRAEGWNITTRTCENVLHHHVSRQVEYVLEPQETLF